MHGSAVGFADPVALHELDLLRPVDGVEVFDQTVAVRGDAHGPLAQFALEHREVAAFGLAFGGDLLVGEHGTQARAPVDRGLGDVGQTKVVEHVGLLGFAQVGPGLAFEPGMARLPDSNCSTSVLIGRAQPLEPDGLVASSSYQAS